MFKSSNDLLVEEGRVDLSFDDAASWASFGPMAISMFTLGDPQSGPLVVLFAIDPMGPTDLKQAMADSWHHKHLSDTFRMPLRGDLIVGRTIYSPGVFRVQEAGKVYGPECAGPSSATTEEWLVLVFADRRGWRVQAANEHDLEVIAAAEEPVVPVYEKAGAEVVYPADSTIVPGVATTLGVPVRAGHADGSFEETEDWAEVGASRMAAIALGDVHTGPIVLTATTPAGQVATPACTWSTDVARFVTGGSCVVAEARHGIGDIRVLDAGVPQDEVVSGPEGLEEVVLIADRTAAVPTFAGHDAGRQWGEDLGMLISQLLPVPAPA
jgi:hypothetical protein